MPQGSGRLSSVAIDDDDLRTALKDGWSLVRFTADGNLDRLVSLPGPAPTGSAFVEETSGPAL